MQIEGTNIMVDKFTHRRGDVVQCIYFLTHFHTDHTTGLTATWHHGTIYCSSITKRLLINKFPNLHDLVVALEMDTPHWIYLDQEKTEGVTVHFFDANHILGAVMILFQGKMGTVLHTGDFRYTDRMLDNPVLFPPHLRNDQLKQIAIDIDHLIIDNTFCDPMFKHPPKHEAFRMLVDIIERHKDHKVVLFLYRSGKEEILIQLSQIFKTIIVVTEDKYNQLKVLGLSLKYFSTSPDDGWIHVRCTGNCSIDNLVECNKIEPTIFIVPSGNSQGKVHPKFFAVPYSSHSNYEELQAFVRAVMPFKMSFIVSYMHKGVTSQRGPGIFLKSYVRKRPIAPKSSSLEESKEEYKVMQEFNKRSSGHKLANKRKFCEANQTVFSHKGKKLKGATFVNAEAVYSLSLPEEEIEGGQEKEDEKTKPHTK